MRCYKERAQAKNIPWDGRAHNKVRSGVHLYDVLRRHAKATDSARFSTSWPRLIEAIHGSPPSSLNDLKSKRTNIRKHLKLMEQWGLVRSEVLTIGTGKPRGLWIELLPVDSIAPGWVAQLVRAHDS